jgi:hypothetical protein
MLKILASNWVAIPVLIGAALSLVLLHIAGRTWEVAVGAVLLLIATGLIILGQDKSEAQPPPPRKRE